MQGTGYAAAAVVLVLTAGCAGSHAHQTDPDPGGVDQLVESSTPPTQAPGSVAPFTPPPSVGEISAVGVGLIRYGMTLAQARGAMGGGLTIRRVTASCAIAQTTALPNTSFEVLFGLMAAGETSAPQLRTPSGVSVGFSTSQLEAAVTPLTQTIAGNGRFAQFSGPAGATPNIVYDMQRGAVTSISSGAADVLRRAGFCL